MCPYNNYMRMDIEIFDELLSMIERVFGESQRHSGGKGWHFEASVDKYHICFLCTLLNHDWFGHEIAKPSPNDVAMHVIHVNCWLVWSCRVVSKFHYTDQSRPTDKLRIVRPSDRGTVHSRPHKIFLHFHDLLTLLNKIREGVALSPLSILHKTHWYAN